VNRILHQKPGAGLLIGIGSFLMTCSAAQAHLSVEGVGELANGALHPLMSPAHVLMFLSLALLLGQQVPFDLKLPLRVFVPASAVALLFTLTGWIVEVYQPLLVLIALIAAICVALEIKPPRWAVGFLCGAVAVGIGLDSSPGEGSVLKTLAGTWLSLNAVLFYIAMCASNGADKKWARTAIRVLGSWIIAISLMVLAFSLRK
jgi:urease accessory protein